MIINISDFNYRGVHFDNFKCEFRGVSDLKEITDEEISRFVAMCLDDAYFPEVEPDIDWLK